MDLLLLHGAVGFWDEIACLVVPATIVMGVALAVLRQDQDEAGRGAAGDEAPGGGAAPDPAGSDGAVHQPAASAGGRAERR